MERRELSASLAGAYLAGCLAVSLGVAAWASSSAKAGAVEVVSVRPPTDTASVAPARAEKAPGAGQKVAVGAGGSSSVLNAGWGAAISTPAATDYTGSERVRVLSLDEWRAIQIAYPENPPLLAKIGTCESGINPSKSVIDENGHRSVGAFMVQPVWWGEVPSDLLGQAKQAASIIREHGTWPFSGAKGCAEWSR